MSGRLGYFTVRVSVPGEPQQQITTIARGPMAAVSAIANFMIGKHPAHKLARASWACRSGWWYCEERVDPGRGPNARHLEDAL